MAHVSISITRDNGLQMNASATVEDADVASIAATLAALVVTGAEAPARPRKRQNRPGLEDPAVEVDPPMTAPAPTIGPALGSAAPLPPAPAV